MLCCQPVIFLLDDTILFFGVFNALLAVPYNHLLGSQYFFRHITCVLQLFFSIPMMPAKATPF